MQQLIGLTLTGWKIVEWRSGRNVEGMVVFHAVNGDGTFGVGWSHDGMRRTTVFSPDRWECMVRADTVYLVRTAEDPRGFDMPRRSVDLYTIEVLTSAR